MSKLHINPLIFQYIIILLFLTFSLHPSSFDTQKFLALPDELQNKIIQYSKINQCFSMNNEEYKKVFNFLSIDYYLTNPNRWTKSEFENAIKFWQDDSEMQSHIKQEYSYLNISNLASWLDAAIHCFFCNGAMDLIIASECRKIRNEQTQIANFNDPHFFEKLSFAQSTTYKGFNPNVKNIFKQIFESHLPKYILHLQPIPLPLMTKQATKHDIQTCTDKIKAFRYQRISYVITSYYFGLDYSYTDSGYKYCHYYYCNSNNFPQWFFVNNHFIHKKPCLLFNKEQTRAIFCKKIAKNCYQTTSNTKTICFLNLQNLTYQQILFLQKIYFYATSRQNASFKSWYYRIWFSIFTIAAYPLYYEDTPQYKLAEEWSNITHHENSKQIGLDIIRQAIQVPAYFQVIKQSLFLGKTYLQLSMIIGFFYIVQSAIRYEEFPRKTCFIFFILLYFYSSCKKRWSEELEMLNGIRKQSHIDNRYFL